MVNNHYRDVDKGKEASVHFQPVISWNTSNQQGTKVLMKDFQGVYKLERLQQGTKENQTQYNQGTKGAGSEDQFGASQQLLSDINGADHVHKSVDVDNGQKCSCLQWIYVSISIYIYIVDAAGSGDTKNDCNNETMMPEDGNVGANCGDDDDNGDDDGNGDGLGYEPGSCSLGGAKPQSDHLQINVLNAEKFMTFK